MVNGERNSCEDDHGVFRAVDDFSVFDGFSCGDDDLDEFIHEDAEPQQEKLLSRTYAYRLFIDGDLSPPVAFASLSNDALKLNAELKAAFDLEEIKYMDFPAVKIGRLGVRAELRDYGIGTNVINIIKRLFLTSNRTGCRFITLDAYNSSRVLNFYLKNDFAFFREKDADKPRRIMFYDLARLRT